MFSRVIEEVLGEIDRGLLQEYVGIGVEDYWEPGISVRPEEEVLQSTLGSPSRQLYTLIRRLEEKYNGVLKQVFTPEGLQERHRVSLFTKLRGPILAYQCARLRSLLEEHLESQFGQSGKVVEIRKGFTLVLIPKE